MRISSLSFCFLLLVSCLCSRLGAQSFNPGVPNIIRQIEIKGNNITRRSVILRELNMAEGDTIHANAIPELINENKRRLINLTLFTTVDIQYIIEEHNHISFQITVQERWYIVPRPIFQLADRNFNVWWTEMNRDPRRINAGLKITDNNFRGNLESLTATVQAGYTQQLALEYIRPYIDKRQRQGIGFAVSVSQSGELAYKTDSNKLLFARLPGTHIIRQYEGAVSWYYRPQYAIRHSLTLAYHNADISDTVMQLNKDYFGKQHSQLSYADISYRLDYNGVDNWNYPLRGIKSINYLVLREGFGNVNWQAQWRTETGIFRQLGGNLNKWYVSAIARGRISLQDDLPYFFQGALGTKTDYIRGYEYYVVNGSHYGLIRMDLKYGLFSKNFRGLPFRYLPELPLRIYPKVFTDAGMAHNAFPGNSFLNDRLLYSGGIGVDIVTAYDLKIRLEAAINHLGQYGLYLHLNSE